MQDFEARLRDAFGQVIDEALGIKLLDAAYYVDDFRLVVQIPPFRPRALQSVKFATPYPIGSSASLI